MAYSVLTSFRTRSCAALFAAVASILALSTPAHGYALSVIGNSDGRACYSAAKAERATPRAFKRCAKALDGVLSDTDRAAILVNRGILHRLDGDLRAAWRDYKAALEINPELPEAFANRGNLFFLSDKYERAIVDYKTALDLGISDERGSRLNIAMSLGNLKRSDEASAAYLDVIRRYPDWDLAVQKYDRYLARVAELAAMSSDKP